MNKIDAAEECGPADFGTGATMLMQEQLPVSKRKIYEYKTKRS
jgi:hypothetical protein